MDLRRRNLCLASGLAAVPARSISALAVLLASAATSRIAHAIEPVTTALAICSAVAGLAASLNKSDGGLSSILKASLANQRVMASQLASLQVGMEQVLSRLSQLPEQMRALVTQPQLDRIATAVLMYRQECARAETFSTYNSWAASDNTKSSLENINNILNESIANVQRGQHYDPLTAVYLSAAMSVSFAVKTGLGEQRRQLLVEAQRFFELFGAVSDSTQAGSTAAELETRQKRLLVITKGLAAQGFALPAPDCQCKPEALLLTVSVQDFVAPDPGKEFCRYRPGADGEVCVTQRRPDPGRVGQTEEFIYLVNVDQKLVNSGIPGTEDFAIRQFATASEITIEHGKAVKFPPGVGSPLASVLRVDAPTSERRLSALKANPKLLAEAKDNLESLSKTLEALNLEIAQIAFCFSAQAAVIAARESLLTEFRR